VSRPLRLSFALALALALALGSGCKGSSSAPTPGGTVSSAEVQWRDGGAADFVIGDRRLVGLPKTELAEGARTPIMQDETGKRLAYLTASGDVRTVHLVGRNAYLGPIVKGPIDFGRAPDLDASLGAMFESAGDKRGQLVVDVRTEKGEAGITRMLIDGAHVDAAEWEAEYAKLPDPRAAEVKSALAARLERGKPSAGLRRAVALVPLREAGRAPLLAARVRELTDPVREPRALAVMLRALASLDKTEGAKVACETLGRSPLDTNNAKGTPEEIDRPGREALVEAAMIAVAAGGAECAPAAAQLGDDACLPYFRCGESGPLTGRETSRQDEPLCTKEQLTRALAQELERTPADVLAITNGTRPQLFAFAALVAADRLPATFTTAHVRRRYALVQPKEPTCDSGVAPGTACHCDEATLRDQTCRQPVSTSVHVGLCKFEVDDKQKKLLNVVAAVAP